MKLWQFFWKHFELLLFFPVWSELFTKVIDVILVIALNSPLFSYLICLFHKMTTQQLNALFSFSILILISGLIWATKFLANIGLRHLTQRWFANKMFFLQYLVYLFIFELFTCNFLPLFFELFEQKFNIWVIFFNFLMNLWLNQSRKCFVILIINIFCCFWLFEKGTSIHVLLSVFHTS